jgi:hypothetical protein
MTRFGPTTQSQFGSILPIEYGVPPGTTDAGTLSPLGGLDMRGGLIGTPGAGVPGANPTSPGLAGLGWNIGTGQLVLGGLSSLGNLWSGIQAQNLAKQQFNFSKDFANANLANQIRSYNTRLEDRARSRQSIEGTPQSVTDEYVARNRMTR